MKKLIAYSLLANVLALLTFVFFTRWIYSGFAFGVVLFELLLITFVSELKDKKSYRVFVIPALLPLMSFYSLELVSLLTYSDFDFSPWLYLSSTLSFIIVNELYIRLIKENYYFKELKYSQKVGARKVAVTCILNGLILSLGIIIFMHIYG